MVREQSGDTALRVIPAAVPRVFFVTSGTRPGAYYRVDTAQPACSCPDWIYRRRVRQGGRRLCKHLAAVQATYPGALMVAPQRGRP